MEQSAEASKEFVKSAEKLSQVVNKLDKDITRRRSWWSSFASGLLQGIGIAIGATVLFVVIFYSLAWLETAPLVGNFASKVMDQIFVEKELIEQYK